MKEAICWIGYNRPEYTKVSLESIFNTENKPINFYAYVDNDGTEKTFEVVEILKSFGILNITIREFNYGCTPNVLRSYQDFFKMEYDVCHYVEDDIILSKEFFNRSRQSLENPKITMFAGCISNEKDIGKIYPWFSTWGSSFKRSLYSFIEPHIEPYLIAWENGTPLEYQIEHFGEAVIDGFDSLLNKIMFANNLLCEFPMRSYSKDIGEYGLHRESGTPPIKTLKEWSNEPIKGVPGYGINGIGFIL